MARSWTQRLSFGDRVPWAIGLLLSLVVAASFSAAFITRHGTSLFAYGALAPELVWKGQVWRLFTWPFLQPSPLSFIFECLMIYWFGRDVAAEWGSKRFLAVFGGVALLAAVSTCLIARVDPSVLGAAYLGSFALTAAMIVAWGLEFPERVVRIYFILPIRGFWVAWFTIGVTVVYAVYSGWQSLLPELFTEAFLLAYLYRESIESAVASKRSAMVRNRERAKKRAKSVAYLKLVDRREEDLPELPPDIERKLRGGPRETKKD
jgi:membrane associated rhomboid family serine protease